MQTFVVRLWLPDRPGALGAVASRIGAVRGDVVGVEILERGGGRAIDELVVELPDASLVSLLVAEMSQVDGVDVEDVRVAPSPIPDAGVEALETAARLVAVPTFEELLSALASHACSGFGAEWAAAIEVEAGVLIASEGAPPPPAWLAAFVAGSRSSSDLASSDVMSSDQFSSNVASSDQLSSNVASSACGAEDVAWAQIGAGRVALVMGRQGRPFRGRERQQLSALCRIAELRRAEVSGRKAGLALSV